MYSTNGAWQLLMEKLVTVLVAYAQQQVQAGADVIQIFDSWAGALSVADYRALLPRSHHRAHPAASKPSASPSSTSVSTPHRSSPPSAKPEPTSSASTGASRSTKAGAPLGHNTAVQGNLDPITLFAPQDVIESRVERNPQASQQTPRPHLQPRPRHRPQHPGRKRAPPHRRSKEKRLTPPKPCHPERKFAALCEPQSSGPASPLVSHAARAFNHRLFAGPHISPHETWGSTMPTRHEQPSHPNIIRRSPHPTHLTRIHHPTRLNQHQLHLVLRIRLVLHATRHHIHLPRAQHHGTIAKNQFATRLRSPRTPRRYPHASATRSRLPTSPA